MTYCLSTLSTGAGAKVIVYVMDRRKRKQERKRKMMERGLDILWVSQWPYNILTLAYSKLLLQSSLSYICAFSLCMQRPDSRVCLS